MFQGGYDIGPLALAHHQRLTGESSDSLSVGPFWSHSRETLAQAIAPIRLGSSCLGIFAGTAQQRSACHLVPQADSGLHELLAAMKGRLP